MLNRAEFGYQVVVAIVDLWSMPCRLGPHTRSEPTVGRLYHSQGIAEAGIKGKDELEITLQC